MATKEVLKKVFEEAYNLNPAAVTAGGVVEHEVIETAMKAIIARDHIEATPEELKEIIEEGIKVLAAAGKDFSFQDWSMPR